MASADSNMGSQESSDGKKDNCPHIAAAFAIEVSRLSMIKKYKTAIAWAATRGAGSRTKPEPPSKKRKTSASSNASSDNIQISVPSCGTCGITLHRPFICLDCSYGGCWHGGHVLSHLKDLGHRFCADVKSGAVYCTECDNLIEEPTLEKIYAEVTLHMEERQTRFLQNKMHREIYRPWKPDAKDTAAKTNASVVPCHGRRGLLNLGQTCYMNAVLQSLLANPLLRNYFLSDSHNNRACKSSKTKQYECMCCELDKLFMEAYSGSPTPFGPTSLLYTMWNTTESLAGYAQHDAHEFFLKALDQLHESCIGSTSVSCNCIVHETFEGQLQSEHVCDGCGSKNAKSDPMRDISLQVKVGEDDTLAGCLRRFTHHETVKYNCSKCGPSSHTSTKRLSIRKLPPLLTFQFKRFEHGGNGKTTPKKIDTHIKFPSTLNMYPYTTLGVSSADKDKIIGPDVLYAYDLFAIVVHEGQVDTGHYISYTRSNDEWYRFDDDKVTAVSLADVLRSNAYMCFYVKRHLEYRPHVNPSYKNAKEPDLAREKEAARMMREVEDELLATV